MAKEKLVLSVDDEIKEKLRLYAKENYTTMSQAVTAWVLTLDVKQGSTDCTGQK